MTFVILPIPPQNVPLFDKATGTINKQWENYFQAMENYLASLGFIPPINARYVLASSNADLPGSVDLGDLASGVLSITVSGGEATVESAPASALTAVNDTNVTLTLSGTPTASLLLPVTATLGWTGQLAVARGGTGVSNATQTYTPTLTNVANISSSTASVHQYSRVGSTVTVSGLIAITASGAGEMRLGVSLPIASNFATTTQCAGTAVGSPDGTPGAVFADTANNRADYAIPVGGATTNNYLAIWQYLVV